MATDWRRTIVEDDLSLVRTTPTRQEAASICLIEPGEVLERTIIDLTWTWRYSPLNEPEYRHWEMLFIGVTISDAVQTAPPIFPRSNPLNEGWIWWQYVPPHHNVWRAAADSEFYDVGTVRIDTTARRKAVGNGTTQSKVWLAVEQNELNDGLTTIIGRQVRAGISCLVTLAP